MTQEEIEALGEQFVRSGVSIDDVTSTTYPSSSRRASNRGSCSGFDQGTGGGANMRLICATSNFYHEILYNRNTKWNILPSSRCLAGAKTVIKLGSTNAPTDCDARIKGDRQAVGHARHHPEHPTTRHDSSTQNNHNSNIKGIRSLTFPMAVLIFILTYAVLVGVLVIYGMCHHEEDPQKEATLWISLPR